MCTGDNKQIMRETYIIRSWIRVEIIIGQIIQRVAAVKRYNLAVYRLDDLQKRQIGENKTQ